ncbi:Putative peptidoglycan binding domain-containing protein [Succiniclasticum ruminis]|uniref:Putative peptidoglycan binding domain-containing protein n=1 Tax=Succiniclasticum ruminis TaxID=40841 RepID=A0A1G6HL52_9FIRM|nr:Putative peptidoglycan binding domain-containing protein [Succiniclasticum ruminis]
MAAGLVASLYLGWGSQLFAAPVITNMPHRADGTRITGSQPVPKEMPRDVAVKTKPVAPKPATPPTQAAPKGETPKPATPKPATPPTQAAPKAEAPKPVTPKPATPSTQAAPKAETPKPATPKPATPPTQAAPKSETPKPATPKPATPPTQAAPKAETPKPATPKPATPPTQAAPKAEAPKPATPKPSVKPATAKLPTKPPGLETKKPDSVKPAAPAKTTKAKKPAKPEQVKAVYKVGDKGWKVKQAQQYLQKLGFDPGETSGQFTKATRKALRKFQKKYKLKETGNLDNATYEELKWQAEAKEYGGNVASTKILKTAAQYKGVPYVFGGTTPRGFDCSGYVQYVFAKHGIRLTRTADTQAREGKFVSRKNLKPGDLVFFTTYEPGASHVGIYAGNNLFWNATSSRGIMLSNLTDSYWGPRYYTARRILTGNDRSR